MYIFKPLPSWLIHYLNSSNEKPTKILIVFYSRYANTARMAEEIAYGAKELPNIKVTIRRIADNVPMEVISKDPAWTKIAEDMNDRYPTIPIEDVIKELVLHKAIVMLISMTTLCLAINMDILPDSRRVTYVCNPCESF
jgi:hypothetical protein